MARNGSGTFSLVTGNPVVTGTTISSTVHNSTMSDIATALTASLAKDGQTTPTANLPMGTYKHTAVGDAAARDQYASAGQVQDGTLTVLSSVTGVDTITATAPVSFAAYAAGQSFKFVSAGANTTAVTLNINSAGAKAVTKNGAVALVAGDIPSGAVAHVVYDGTRFQLLNVGTLLDSADIGVAVQAYDADIPTVAGTAAEIITGTETAVRSWAPDDLNDAINSLATTISTTSVVTTTSGATKDITVPAGTKYAIIPLLGVSMDASAAPMVQLGDAGGIEATGYTGTTANNVPTISCIGWSTGALLTGDPVASTMALSGHIILTLANPATNTWAISINLGENISGSSGEGFKGAGQKSLSAAITTIRLTSVAGTAAFDLGSIGEGIFF